MCIFPDVSKIVDKHSNQVVCRYHTFLKIIIIFPLIYRVSPLRCYKFRGEVGYR